MSHKAMLGSAPQHSAFARREETQKQQRPESPFLSISAEIHMAINKSSYGFCAPISRRGAPEKIYEQTEETRPDFIGLAGSGHTNSSSLSFMDFFPFFLRSQTQQDKLRKGGN